MTEGQIDLSSDSELKLLY